MATESANGSDPAERSNGADPLNADENENFERFERLTRKLVNTPKSEVDKRLEQAKRKKRAPARS
jgi:hypothetical protein